MGHQRVIRGAKIDEPAPILELPQQNGHRMEGTSNHGRPLLRHRICVLHHSNIAELDKGGFRRGVHRQIGPLPGRRGAVEVQEVEVPRVVRGLEEPLEPATVALSSGDQVGQARGLRRSEGARGSAEIGGAVGFEGAEGSNEEEEERKERDHEKEHHPLGIDRESVDDAMGLPHRLPGGLDLGFRHRRRPIRSAEVQKGRTTFGK